MKQMKKVTVNKLMDIENILLLIKKDYLHKLSMSEIIVLYDELSRIGKITNIYFSVQMDVKDKISLEELKLFHKNLIEEEFDFDLTKTISFIEKVKSKVTDESLLGCASVE